LRLGRVLRFGRSLRLGRILLLLGSILGLGGVLLLRGGLRGRGLDLDRIFGFGGGLGARFVAAGFVLRRSVALVIGGRALAGFLLRLRGAGRTPAGRLLVPVAGRAGVRRGGLGAGVVLGGPFAVSAARAGGLGVRLIAGAHQGLVGLRDEQDQQDQDAEVKVTAKRLSSTVYAP
jgi:hypothetical protein